MTSERVTPEAQDLTERLRAGADIVAQRQKIPRALLFPLLRAAASTIEALTAERDELIRENESLRARLLTPPPWRALLARTEKEKP